MCSLWMYISNSLKLNIWNILLIYHKFMINLNIELRRKKILRMEPCWIPLVTNYWQISHWIKTRSYFIIPFANFVTTHLHYFLCLSLARSFCLLRILWRSGFLSPIIIPMACVQLISVILSVPYNLSFVWVNCRRAILSKERREFFEGSSLFLDLPLVGLINVLLSL